MIQLSILEEIKKNTRTTDILKGKIQQLENNGVVLPSQTNQAGKVLTTNGETTSWTELAATNQNSNLDEVPTLGSIKGVTSGGVYNSLKGKVDIQDGKALSDNNFTDAYQNKLDGIASVHSDFKDVAYSSILSIPYDSTYPNVNITGISGNLSLSITGTIEGNSGIVTIQLTSGSELITLNGTVELGNFPTGAGKVVSLSYIHQPEGLKWFCNNPNLNKTSSDIEISDYTKGIIMYTSDGTKARVTLVKIGGNLTLQISNPL